MKLAKCLGAAVTALHVTPSFHAFTYRSQVLLTYHTPLTEDSAADYKAAVHGAAKKILSIVARAAAAQRVSCKTLEAEGDQPFAAIVETAKSRGCDLIVMASHGHSGVAGVLLGSETQKVLTHSATPVLVYR